ncbi:hypothetical protein MASR2M78_08470 [Treponema sp.]
MEWYGSLALPLYKTPRVLGMQEFMGKIPQRLTQKVLIQGSNCRVFMRLSQGKASVLLINGGLAGQAGCGIAKEWLPATTQAAPRAAHDFHKGIGGFPFYNFI